MNSLIIEQWKCRGKEDSFWYEGLIASIGDYRLIACGEIRVNFPKDEEWYKNGRAVEEAELKSYTDKDLKKLEWGNNNWFEVVKGTVKNGIVHVEDCMDCDVSYDYDEAIDKLLTYYHEKVYAKK